MNTTSAYGKRFGGWCIVTAAACMCRNFWSEFNAKIILLCLLLLPNLSIQSCCVSVGHFRCWYWIFIKTSEGLGASALALQNFTHRHVTCSSSNPLQTHFTCSLYSQQTRATPMWNHGYMMRLRPTVSPHLQCHIQEVLSSLHCMNSPGVLGDCHLSISGIVEFEGSKGTGIPLVDWHGYPYYGAFFEN